MLVTKIQKFCTHDGPGVRTTVFFKGCGMRCRWCHNPETQSGKPQIFYTAADCIMCGACTAVCPAGAHIISEGESADIHTFNPEVCRGCLECTRVCPTGACEPCATNMSVEEIVAAVCRDIPFYSKDGGVTLSGGEPLLHPEAAGVLRKCKEAGMTTAVETAGFVPRTNLLAAAGYTDLFLFDFKDGDRERHREYTGVYPDEIWENLLAADGCGVNIIMRCILVNGVNTDMKNYSAIADMYGRLRHVEAVELIPYHAYAGSKAVQLGQPDNGVRRWIPDADTVGAAVLYLESRGVNVIINK